MVAGLGWRKIVNRHIEQLLCNLIIIIFSNVMTDCRQLKKRVLIDQHTADSRLHIGWSGLGVLANSYEDIYGHVG